MVAVLRARGKQCVKWTTEGAVKGAFAPSIPRRINRVKAEEYDCIPQRRGVTQLRETRWHHERYTRP